MEYWLVLTRHAFTIFNHLRRSCILRIELHLAFFQVRVIFQVGHRSSASASHGLVALGAAAFHWGRSCGLDFECLLQ